MSAKETASKHSQEDNSEELTLGQYLRNERERRSMSPEMLHQKTGIQLSVIRALENDQRHELPADVFLRGLIKLYTKALDLDPQPALDLHQSANGTNPVKDATITHRDLLSTETLAESPLFLTKKKLLFSLFFLLLLMLAYLVFLNRPLNYLAWQSFLPASEKIVPSTDTTPNKPAPQVSKTPAFQQTATETAGENPSENEQTVVEGIEQQKDETSAPSAEEESMPPISRSAEQIEQQKTQPQPQEKAETGSEQKTLSQTEEENPQGGEASAPVPHPGHTLSATFSEMTWVRIVIDDNQIKEAFFRPGSTATWNADQKMEILLGNSGGASLVFDGSPVKLDGRTGKVVHLTLP